MAKSLEVLTASAMLSCIEGYASLVFDSVEFELGRELTNEEGQQVYKLVEGTVEKALTKPEPNNG